MRLEKKQLEPHDLTLRALTPSDKEIVCIWITSPFVVHYSFVVAGPQSTARKMRKKSTLNNILICLYPMTIGKAMLFYGAKIL